MADAANTSGAGGAAGAPAAKKRRAGGYLFLPRAVQTATVLTWLRRTHAWTGFWGALFFFCLGLSGIYLNHRGTMRLDPGAAREVKSLDVIAPAAGFDSEEAFQSWAQDEFDIQGELSRGRRGPGGPGGGRGEQVSFNGQAVEQPAEWSASWRGPNSTVTATHVVGSGMVHVAKTDSGFLRMIMDLHKVVGVNAAFILLMDTMAGGMMVMALTGVLLWTRLHGPRLTAAGIVGGMLVLTVATLSQTWVGAQF